MYFYGHTNPKFNLDLFEIQCKNLSQNISKRLELDKEVRHSGLIVDTFACVDMESQKLLMNCISLLNCNVLIVLDNEKIYNDIQSNFSNDPNVEVIRIPKWGGVAQKDEKFRRNAKINSIRDYFYGSNKDFSPIRITLSLDKVQIFRLGEYFISL